MEMLDYILKRSEEMAGRMDYEKYLAAAQVVTEKGVYGRIGIESVYDGYMKVEFVELQYSDIANDYYIGYHGRAEAKIYKVLTEEFKRVVSRVRNNDQITPNNTLDKIVTAFAYEIFRRKLVLGAVKLGYLD